MFLKMAILQAIYQGNIGKTAKIAHFVHLNPLNGLFHANFIAYPLGANARHILGQIWEIKIFVLGQGGPQKRSKMVIFGHFQVKTGNFHPWDTLNSDFGAKMGLWTRVEHYRTNSNAFSQPLSIRFFNIAQILTWDLPNFVSFQPKTAFGGVFCF